MLTQEHLKELLTYDPDTGVFRWRLSNSNRAPAGAVAGMTDRQGYRQIRLDGQRYRAHRIAFLYMEGAMPPAEVDHINGVPGDNRWCNLRHANRIQNLANTRVRETSTTGAKGVRRSASGKRFKARIQLNGKEHYLGTFNTIAEASAAYERAANNLHGEYARAA